ncbi:MAG: suppressor of fused domain protein [bacterium]
MRNLTLIFVILIIISCSKQDDHGNMNIFKKILNKKETIREFTEEEFTKYNELKMAGLEYILGKSYNFVFHSVMPYDLGGLVDLCCFPNGIKGTGFATMELIQPDGTGPIKNSLGTYELVAFTKLPLVQDTNETIPFNLIKNRICRIFTCTGLYSSETKLEPLETCDIPLNKDEPSACCILDEYKPAGKEFKIGEKKHGLLLIIEVHRNEMEYAMANGTEELIKKLKDKGYYPYSDLDRESVIK